jgi:uncharacterized protein YjiS (DUF1127 family)
MSTIADHSPSLPVSRRIRFRAFGQMVQSTQAALRAWQRSMRQRHELLMLNDVELRDLSLSEADVNREARKPFWETIGLTDRWR